MDKTKAVKQRQISEKQRAALEAHKFQPGQSGNPAGRPKSITLSEAIRKELEKESPEGQTNAEAIAERIVKQAKSGRLSAISEIADRTEGKPTQKNEHAGPGGGPIPMQLHDLVLKVYGDDTPTGNGNPA